MRRSNPDPRRLASLAVTLALIAGSPLIALAAEEAAGSASPADSTWTDDEVVVTASRYGSDVHLSHSNLSRAEIRRRQTEVDIPLLLEDVPGVFSYSDAGNGVGYAYLKIRGFDQRRVGVLVNGIPLNDPEDHQVYWVDLPDLASSVEDIQVQRGVTNSVGGLAAIGGTVNLVTDRLTAHPEGRLVLQTGSYGTSKQTLSWQSGLLDGGLSTALRISHLESRGYRRNAGSDQWAVFWSGRWESARHALQANVYTGRELSKHAWDAEAEDVLAEDRRSNPETYHNAIDDFRQPHFELHHDFELSGHVTLQTSAYLIHGQGFYENLKEGETASDFSLDVLLSGVEPDTSLNVVRRKWVRKDQIGLVTKAVVQHGGGRLVVGGDAYTFHSNHWGDVLSVGGVNLFDGEAGLKYHDFTGDKQAWALFVNEERRLVGGLTLLADVQFQHREYDFLQGEVGHFRGADRHAYTVEYDFFNPKGGLHWQSPGGSLGLWGYVGVNHREPADSDFFDGWSGPDDFGVAPLFADYTEVLAADGSIDHRQWSGPLVEEEKVVDYELGAAWRGSRLAATVNGYWMDFTNEIVPSGQVDDDGFPIRGNAGKTLHRGIELGVVFEPTPAHELSLAASRSWDEFDEYVLQEAVYDVDWNFLGVNEVDYSGNPIALFPDRLAALTWRADWGAFDTGLRIKHVGQQWLDNSGLAGHTIDSHMTVDLSLGARLDRIGLEGLGDARAELRIRNILDEEYEVWGWYYGQRYLIPAATRNVLAGVSYDF